MQRENEKLKAKKTITDRVIYECMKMGGGIYNTIKNLTESYGLKWLHVVMDKDINMEYLYSLEPVCANDVKDMKELHRCYTIKTSEQNEEPYCYLSYSYDKYQCDDVKKALGEVIDIVSAE